ncbi:hypothetical protein E4U54_003930 [Claviceps lovelessii]|nr:hypothetical protein E4U54_003930 [Claviceps lovelessii]
MYCAQVSQVRYSERGGGVSDQATFRPQSSNLANWQHNAKATLPPPQSTPQFPPHHQGWRDTGNLAELSSG